VMTWTWSSLVTCFSCFSVYHGSPTQLSFYGCLTQRTLLLSLLVPATSTVFLGEDFPSHLLIFPQIMLSAYHGHAPLVTLLLQHGADPNRLNDRGQSPLAGAVFKNERQVIQALLAGNADPRIGEPSALDACKVCYGVGVTG
jgi:hypothetical protein